uniref:PHD finger protein ALFIN-LIKE n=1 Tax=Leersia perrieri TaxID=77586 RepID=A0A0D9UX07_9ORYZ
MDASSGRSSRVAPLHSIDDIFSDFFARRSAIIRALTEDLQTFVALCDPDLDGMCLYGNSDGTWELAPLPEMVPPDLPEPVLGVNHQRGALQVNDWIAILACHCDSWLLAVAFFHGARLDCDGRVRLFDMINDLPTVYEVVFGAKQSRKRSSMDNGTRDTLIPEVANIAEDEAHEEDDEYILLKKRDDGEIYLRRRDKKKILKFS